jgi:hypothetical protein
VPASRQAQPAGSPIPGNEPFSVDNLVRLDSPQLTVHGFGCAVASGPGGVPRSRLADCVTVMGSADRAALRVPLRIAPRLLAPTGYNPASRYPSFDGTRDNSVAGLALQGATERSVCPPALSQRVQGSSP